MRVLRVVTFWLQDVQRRIRELNESIDALEERYVSLRADVFRKRTGR